MGFWNTNFPCAKSLFGWNQSENILQQNTSQTSSPPPILDSRIQQFWKCLKSKPVEHQELPASNYDESDARWQEISVKLPKSKSRASEKSIPSFEDYEWNKMWMDIRDKLPKSK